MVNKDEYIIMVTKDFHFYLLPFFLFGPIFLSLAAITDFSLTQVKRNSSASGRWAKLDYALRWN